tara:strand:+ start:2425 stop:2970 length:546 start_codon:yes stop_codon:yes gene_type:complete
MKASKINQKLKKIKLLALDVDGVLTNGSIYISSDGSEMKQFSIEDSTGAAFARSGDIELALISGRYSKATDIRSEELKIKICHQGVLNKLDYLEKIASDMSLSLDEVAYVGDSYVDVPPIKAAGLGIAVSDAHPVALEVADFVSSSMGGEGVLLEVVELILKSKGQFDSMIKEMEKKVYNV